MRSSAVWYSAAPAIVVGISVVRVAVPCGEAEATLGGGRRRRRKARFIKYEV